MAQIIDGLCDFDNVTADMIARHNMSMYGTGDYVLQIDECLEYDLVSNNEIHVKDGMYIMQGRRGCVKKGTTDICIIENGAQAVNRNDIIVIEYVKDEATRLESHTTKVIKGVPAEVAVDPELVTGDINAGAVLHQMPLYRVKIEGLNVVAVEQMFEMGSVAAETVNPMEATEPGFAADALAVKNQFDEQNKNLGGFTPIIDDTGKITGYKTSVGGADTVFPFSRLEYVYNEGKFFDLITTFEYKTTNKTKVLNFNEDHIQIGGKGESGGTYLYTVVATDKSIDLTDYSYMLILGTIYGNTFTGNGDNELYIGKIQVGFEDANTATTFTAIESLTNGAGANANLRWAIPLKDITGNKFMYIKAGGWRTIGKWADDTFANKINSIILIR